MLEFYMFSYQFSNLKLIVIVINLVIIYNKILKMIKYKHNNNYKVKHNNEKLENIKY
jgi:hypothetical protein